MNPHNYCNNVKVGSARYTPTEIPSLLKNISMTMTHF